MVNGTPANSVTVLSGGVQITFHFDTSPTVQGQNTMHIPAGAFFCSQGKVQEFTCAFTYQPSTPTPKTLSYTEAYTITEVSSDSDTSPVAVAERSNGHGPRHPRS